jgi:ATP-dependent 26S proteasome regulatory subunit
MAAFLNLMDGFQMVNGVLIIATCNHPEWLDSALPHRPGRFDRIWRFPLPG